MKRITSHITIVLAVLMVASCNWFEDPVPMPKGEFRLTLMTTGLDTKGPETGAAGETNLNENLIDTVDIFFYQNGADNNTNAVHCLKMALPAGSNSIVSLNIPISADEIVKIFGTAPAVPAATTARIYVIANATNPARSMLNQIMANAASSTPSYAGTSINSLKHLEILKPGPYTSQTESSFVMDGYSVVTLSADRTTISGHVKMDRSGCKVRLFITQIDTVTTIEGSDTLVWIPQPQYMRLFFFNGSRKTHIDETLHPFTPASSDYFTIRGNNMVLARTLQRMPADASQPLQYWFNTIPYYSYPFDFNPSGDLDQTSLVLVLPWLCPIANYEHSHNTYYQIPITSPTNGLDLTRNSYYQIYVTLSMLGNFEESDPVEIPISFIVADWTTAEIKAEMRDYKYLTVDRNYEKIVNQNTGLFKYSSSSPVTVKINTVKYFNYAQNNFQEITLNGTGNPATTHSVSENRMVYPPGGTAHQELDTYTVSVEPDNIIKFERIIPDGVFTISTINFTVTNEDGFSETIVVEQYPPIYLTGEKSTVYNTGPTNNQWGSVIVYGYRSRYGSGNRAISDDSGTTGNLGSVQDFPTVTGTGNTKNNNQNQYTVYVGSLAEGFINGDGRNYAIGDPRVPISQAGPVPGLQNYGTTFKLNQYRKSRQDASDMIAPAFKIASSYGKTIFNVLSFTQAEKRCAAYQENGYPAGRWRVPTEAEILFIVNRSEAGVFPALFDGKYWASSGRCYNSASKQFESGIYQSVRCVYDVWYWGDAKGDYNSDGTIDYGIPMIGDNPDGIARQWGPVR